MWNKKGLLYDQYKYLVNTKDNEGNYRWPDKVAKAFLGMSRETWRSIRQNKGFFTAKGAPRQRKAKQLVPVRNAEGKFKAVEGTQEARELTSATRFEIIYDKLLQPGDASMKRMRNTRKRTEALIKDAVESNIISQEWGKNMADAWRAANAEMLEFKEAAVKRIRELEEELRKRDTASARDGESSLPPRTTPATVSALSSPSTPRDTSPESMVRIRVVEQIKTEPSSGDVVSAQGEPSCQKENSPTAGGLEASQGSTSTPRQISTPNHAKSATGLEVVLWQGAVAPNFHNQS